VTFTQYIKQFFEPVSMLSTRYTVLQSAMAGAERIFQLLDVEERDAPPLPPRECVADGPPDEALFLENVWFEYKAGAPVLKDVTLVAKKGERIALVGATGAGKTTVSSIVLRLYEVSSGKVRGWPLMRRSMEERLQITGCRAQYAVNSGLWTVSRVYVSFSGACAGVARRRRRERRGRFQK